MGYTVKAVSELAAISIRTLHHYDEIGLLRPAGASPAGYRLYSDADLERLQQILFFRELGFGLPEIKEMIESPAFDRKRALREHRKMLLEKQRRLSTLIASVDRTLESLERGTNMSKKQMFEGFDDATQKKYQEEARARWGHSDAYKESERRTSKYTKEDWDVIKAEGRDITLAIADRMDRDPGDADVQEWVGMWRGHITKHFYNCTLEIFRGLGEMYVADERFAAFYDKVKPGLAVFMEKAMTVYCDRAEAAKS